MEEIMIKIDMDWRPFIVGEMPQGELEIVVVIAPSLESDPRLKLGIDFWTGARTETFREKRILYWAPRDTVKISEKSENIDAA